MAITTVSGYTFDPAAAVPVAPGRLCTAEKDGLRYRCLQYDLPVRSGSDGDPFDKFGREKNRLYTQLRNIFGQSDLVLIPTELVAYEDHWLEFTLEPDGIIPTEDRLAEAAALAEPERIRLLLDITQTLQQLHLYHIVHSALDPRSVVLHRDGNGTIHAALAGLENAFSGAALTAAAACDPAYRSPEQALPDPQPGSVTTGSDIFSLGIFFHQYLAGCAPEADALPSALQHSAPGPIFPWQILTTPNPDGTFNQLKISERITDPVWIALISDMLHPDASARPDPTRILRRLDKQELPIETKTWPGHGITINPDVAQRHTIGLRTREIPRKGMSPDHRYEIIARDGRRFCGTHKDLIRMGIASVVEVVEDPWPTDSFQWDTEKLKTMFACVRRGTKPGLYQMMDRTGNTRQCTLAQLRMLRFAIPKGKTARSSETPEASRPAGIPPGGLWPDDAGAFRINPPEIAMMGLLFDGPVELCGIWGYQFTDIHGASHFISRSHCHQLQLLIPTQPNQYERN